LKISSNAEFGDFQTPPALVNAVLRTLRTDVELAVRILEPSCGSGAFLAGLLSRPAKRLREIKAFELQRSHLAAARKLTDRYGSTIEFRHADILSVNLRQLEWTESGPLLIVGNPPWITSSALGALRSTNVPLKHNLHRLRGIDAMTGASNFDLTEYIWWKLLTELEAERPTIALLSKTSVARRVLRLARQLEIPIANARMHRIDAKKWFGASVDACLFSLSIGARTDRYEALVYDELEAPNASATMGFVGDSLVADVAAYSASRFIEGRSRFTWRQGVKHDVAAVMELRCVDGRYRNGLDEEVNVESKQVYPLLKSSDVHRGSEARRAVLITQRTLSNDPGELAQSAPRTWQYLSRHVHLFERRKSSIYRGRPQFSMFGIGDYSFAPYKVAIAGLYKEPRFRLVGPVEGRPVMFDDTCYFVSFEDPAMAALLCALLNHPETRQFIAATAFWDSKRPITKKLLQRVDTQKVSTRVGIDELTPDAVEGLSELIGEPGSVDWAAVMARVLGDDSGVQLTLA
jgi:hypothetical protein